MGSEPTSPYKAEAEAEWPLPSPSLGAKPEQQWEPWRICPSKPSLFPRSGVGAGPSTCSRGEASPPPPTAPALRAQLPRARGGRGQSAADHVTRSPPGAATHAYRVLDARPWRWRRRRWLRWLWRLRRRELHLRLDWSRPGLMASGGTHRE